MLAPEDGDPDGVLLAPPPPPLLGHVGGHQAHVAVTEIRPLHKKGLGLVVD